MERVIRLGALNIVTQPHSAARYQELLFKVKNRRKAGRMRGDRFGMLGLMSKTDHPGKSGAYIEGLITTFTQINVDGDWANIFTGAKAEEADIEGLNIPDNIRPNPAFNRFRFYLKEHLFVFEIGNGGYRLTPNNAEKLFDRLFSAPSIQTEFGEVSVTAYPSKDSVGNILRSKHLQRLYLVIHTPNPDDGENAEARLMQRLDSMNAKRLDQVVVAKRDGFIAPDALLIQEAKIAAKNGRVDAKIKRDGRSKDISTKDSAYIYVHTYSIESNTTEREFGIAAEVVRHQLRESE